MDHLSTEWFGPVLIRESGAPDARPWPADPDEIARRLLLVQRGEVTPEERAIVEDHGPCTVHDARLLRIPGTTLARPRRARTAPPTHPPSLYHAACVHLTQHATRDGLARLDLHLQQAVAALDDTNAALNLVHERLAAWMIYHTPEPALRNDHAALLASARKAVDEEPGTGEGAALHPGEAAALRSLASSADALQATRAQLEGWIDQAMRGLAPNLVQLVGPRIGARLILLSRGLDRLARLPAGTIQTLGAEKALFAHLVSGTPPPKHGVLFQHPLVHQAPPRARGGMARALASAVSHGARADAITGNDIAKQLLERVRARARIAHPRQDRHAGRWRP